QGLRRGPRRPDLGRYHARPGLDVHRDLPGRRGRRARRRARCRARWGPRMMTDLSLVIPLAFLCVVSSAFCSGVEVALFSIRRVERDQLKSSPRFIDRRIAGMLEKPRRLIASLLVGSEAFNSLLAVLAFVVLQQWYSPWRAFWL